MNAVIENYVQERIAKAVSEKLNKQLKQEIKLTARREKEALALRMLQAGKLALDEIVEYSGLSMTAVKRLAKQTASK